MRALSLTEAYPAAVVAAILARKTLPAGMLFGESIRRLGHVYLAL